MEKDTYSANILQGAGSDANISRYITTPQLVRELEILVQAVNLSSTGLVRLTPWPKMSLIKYSKLLFGRLQRSGINCFKRTRRSRSLLKKYLSLKNSYLGGCN
jgi:hypothetical protein